ncbi:MAG TPA: hypothetical protein VJ987_13765 [Anaerolineales bacterium]|nr:hypothetical protein [Anaerolineales bacterium]
MKIKLSLMFTISAIAMFLIGLGLTVMTSLMLGMLGLDANSASIHFAKAGGSALIGVAVMTWLARNASSSDARNALTLGLTLLFLLETIEYLRGIFMGSLGSIAWIAAGMWLLLFVFMFMAGRSTMAEEK